MVLKVARQGLAGDGLCSTFGPGHALRAGRPEVTGPPSPTYDATVTGARPACVKSGRRPTRGPCSIHSEAGAATEPPAASGRLGATVTGRVQCQALATIEIRADCAHQTKSPARRLDRRSGQPRRRRSATSYWCARATTLRAWWRSREGLDVCGVSAVMPACKGLDPARGVRLLGSEPWNRGRTALVSVGAATMAPSSPSS